MCGRFVASSSAEHIADFFGASFNAESLPANFNVAPTADVYGVVAGPDGVPSLQIFHWGLVPSWAKDIKIGSKMTNARSETLAEKPAFKSLFRTHRVILPMDGFYEWRAAHVGAPLTKAGKPIKQPMFIHRADGEPLSVAGLWGTWRDRSAGPDAPWLHSCTVITTSANELMRPVHDRMPVMLDRTDWHEWLDPGNTDLDVLGRLLVPAPEHLLTMHAVSTEVNDSRNSGSQLIDPI